MKQVSSSCEPFRSSLLCRFCLSVSLCPTLALPSFPSSLSLYCNHDESSTCTMNEKKTVYFIREREGSKKEREREREIWYVQHL